MTTQYIITDPCYILDDTTWSNVCNECFDNSPEQYEKFDKRISEELNKLAGTTNALASGTGYGDWSNYIRCSNYDKVLQAEFFADSGMVCVVEYNEAIKQALIAKNNQSLIEKGGIALIKTEGTVKVKMDTRDSNWTVVEIKDDNDNFNSMLPTDDEEEDEWED